MKRIIKISLLLLLFMSSVITVSAEDNKHVYDNSKIFSQSEEDNLEEIFDLIENNKYLGFFIVSRTDDDNTDLDTEEYVENFIYENNIDTNYYGGQVLIFDFSSYEYLIYNYGYMDIYFSESDMQGFYGVIEDSASDGNYAMAFNYAELAELYTRNFDASNISTTGPVKYLGVVSDYANLFTQEEEILLENKINNFREEYDFDLAILTVNSTNGENIVTFSEDYYVDNNLGLGADQAGIVYVIDMGDRAVYLATSGELGIRAFTDYGIDSMNDEIAAELADGDYYEGMEILIDTSSYYLDNALNGNSVDRPFFDPLSILISLGAGLVIALIVLLVSINSMNNAKKKSMAKAYIKPGTFDITRSRDTYLYSNFTKTAKPKNKSSRGGGGGSFHSGSGGRSFGGGGRHF